MTYCIHNTRVGPNNTSVESGPTIPQRKNPNGEKKNPLCPQIVKNHVDYTIHKGQIIDFMFD